MGLGGPRCGWRLGVAAALFGGVLPLVHAADADFGRVIVKLKPNAAVLRSSLVQAQSAGGSGGSPMGRLGVKRGLTVQDGRDIGNHMHVAFAKGLSSEALAASLSKDSDVLYAVPDRLRKPMTFSGPPADPLFAGGVGNTQVEAGQWYLRPHDETFPAAIGASSTWGLATGRDVTVAVLDSGVRFDHPDLRNKLHPGYNMISVAAVSGARGGRSNDASDLGDWVSQADIGNVNAGIGTQTGCTEDPTSSWHGTQVAGIIAAETNNGIGMASVAPDAKVLPVRVLGKCGGWDSDILAGMRWAAGLTVTNMPVTSHPAKVLNMSLGADDACPRTYKDVLAELAARNVVVVASAGNANGEAVSSPANCPGVIAVAGLRHVGTKVGFSSLGPQVSISAPGGNCVNDGAGQACLFPILTSSNSGTTVPVSDAAGGSIYSDSYERPSYGTSFAAPQVSGAVALMLEARPTLTPGAVRSLLMSSARPFPISGGSVDAAVCHLANAAAQDECYCTTLTCGAGMLDVNAAVQAASSASVAVITISPDSPMVGQLIHFSGAGSMPSPRAGSIVSYQWRLLDDGGGIVNSSGWAADSADLSVSVRSVGTFRISLKVVDNLGQTAQSDQWVLVQRPSITGASATATGGGRGGGSVSWLDLVALGLACGLVILTRRPGPFKA
jgi:serine protease